MDSDELSYLTLFFFLSQFSVFPPVCFTTSLFVVRLQLYVLAFQHLQL